MLLKGAEMPTKNELKILQGYNEYMEEKELQENLYKPAKKELPN